MTTAVTGIPIRMQIHNAMNKSGAQMAKGHFAESPAYFGDHSERQGLCSRGKAWARQRKQYVASRACRKPSSSSSTARV